MSSWDEGWGGVEEEFCVEGGPLFDLCGIGGPRLVAIVHASYTILCLRVVRSFV